MKQDTPDRRSSALVVDDEAIIRMDAVSILEDAGFQVLEARNADEAIQILHNHHASIMILFTDVAMPGSSLDGFALARETARLWPAIAILVASGRHRPGPGDMPDGAEFVAKPFSGEVVIEKLKRILPASGRPEPLRH